MSAAIDHTTFVKRLKASGMPEQQAETVTALIQEAASAPRDRVNSLARSSLNLGGKLDHVIEVQEQQGEAIAELRSGQTRLEAMLSQLLDGQSVLIQNDMELKRRLDQKS